MPTAPGAISRVIHTCAWCGREGTRGFGACDGRTRCTALTTCNRRVERFRKHTYREGGADTRAEKKGEK